MAVWPLGGSRRQAQVAHEAAIKTPEEMVEAGRKLEGKTEGLREEVLRGRVAYEEK